MATRRTERVGNLIRNTLGEILLAKMSDPRFDPAKVSITKVELPEDLLSARVFISVNGDKTDENKALSALKHARGFLQDRLMRQISLRHTPRLSFVVDKQFKKTVETLNLISSVSQELEEKDSATDSNPDSQESQES